MRSGLVGVLIALALAHFLFYFAIVVSNRRAILFVPVAQASPRRRDPAWVASALESQKRFEEHFRRSLWLEVLIGAAVVALLVA